MKRFGDLYLPDRETHMIEYFQRLGSDYQPIQRERSLEFVGDHSLAVDIGAHIGTWSRALVERFTRVIAFEPLAEMRECLRMNVPSERLEIVPMALGERHGAVAIDFDGGNSGGAHVVPQQRGWIPLGMLDDFELPNLGYMKIDTEGFERQVLAGAVETLRRHRPVVVIEQKRHAGNYFGEETYAAAQLLESLGAQLLDRIKDDMIYGWPDAPGKVRMAAPRPLEQRAREAATLAKSGDLVGAERTLLAMTREVADRGDIWQMLANLAAQRSDLPAALSRIEEALAIEPTNQRFVRTRALLLQAAGAQPSAARQQPPPAGMEREIRVDIADTACRQGSGENLHTAS